MLDCIKEDILGQNVNFIKTDIKRQNSLKEKSLKDINFHNVHENDLEIYDHIRINCSLSFKATAIIR